MNLAEGQADATDPLSLEEKRRQKTLLQKTLLRAVVLIGRFFNDLEPTDEDESEISIKIVLQFLHKNDLFKELPEPARTQAETIISKRLEPYLAQRQTVSFYRQNYQGDLQGLLEYVFEGHLPPPGKKPLRARWEPDCVTIIAPSRIYNLLGAEGYTHRSSGFSLTNGEGVNLSRRGKRPVTQATHEHEWQHQVNRFLLPTLESELDRAQDEILACMKENYRWGDLIQDLIEANGIYDYYQERKPLAEKGWRVYCRRVVKGIQIAMQIGKERMDELCITPMSQWKKLLEPPPKEDFFCISPRRDDYYPEHASAHPLEGEITQIFQSPCNKALVEKAGLGDPDKLKALMPENTDWIFTPTESGIFTFSGISGAGTGLEVVFVPSLEAIYTFAGFGVKTDLQKKTGCV